MQSEIIAPTKTARNVPCCCLAMARSLINLTAKEEAITESASDNDSASASDSESDSESDSDSANDSDSGQHQGQRQRQRQRQPQRERDSADRIAGSESEQRQW